MALPISLTSLTTREAITDAVYRGIRGFDRNDIEFFNSAFTEDASFIINGQAYDGLTTIRDKVFTRVLKLDTMHTISNIRIDVKDGANTARLSAFALAQHCPLGRGVEPDGPKFVGAGEYIIDLVLDKADNLWKVKKWVLDLIWTQGDPSVTAQV